MNHLGLGVHLLVMDLPVPFLLVSDYYGQPKTSSDAKKPELLSCHVIFLFFLLPRLLSLFSVWKPTIVPNIHTPSEDYF